MGGAAIIFRTSTVPKKKFPSHYLSAIANKERLAAVITTCQITTELRRALPELTWIRFIPVRRPVIPAISPPKLIESDKPLRVICLCL